MLRQSLVLFALFALNVNANAVTEKDPDTDFLSLEIEKLELEQILFGSILNEEILEITAVDFYQVEEEVVLNFNPETYLPENFDARKGMYDLDWSTITLIEIEEEVDLGFNPKAYLPKNFNAYKGMACKDKELVIASF